MPALLASITGLMFVTLVLATYFDRYDPPEKRSLVNWREAEAGMAEAVETGRPILYQFTADWCPPCKAMKSAVFADPDSAKFINARFVPIRIKDERSGGDPRTADVLMARYGVKAFPTLVVTAPDGAVLNVLEGYRGAGDVAEFLKVSAEKADGGPPG